MPKSVSRWSTDRESSVRRGHQFRRFFGSPVPSGIDRGSERRVVGAVQGQRGEATQADRGVQPPAVVLGVPARRDRDRERRGEPHQGATPFELLVGLMHLLDRSALPGAFDPADLASYLGRHRRRHLRAAGGAVGDGLADRPEEHSQRPALADLGRHERAGERPHHGPLARQQDGGGDRLPLAVAVAAHRSRRVGRASRRDRHPGCDVAVVAVMDHGVGEGGRVTGLEPGPDRDGQLRAVEPGDLRAADRANQPGLDLAEDAVQDPGPAGDPSARAAGVLGDGVLAYDDSDERLGADGRAVDRGVELGVDVAPRSPALSVGRAGAPIRLARCRRRGRCARRWRARRSGCSPRRPRRARPALRPSGRGRRRRPCRCRGGRCVRSRPRCGWRGSG